MSTAVSSDLLPHAIDELLPGILQKSFGLFSISLLLGIVVGIILGTLAARRRRRSLLVVLVSFIGISASSFFMAFFSGEILRGVYARDKGLDGNLPEG